MMTTESLSNNPYALATLADCGTPDGIDSRGARFLLACEASYFEAVGEGRLEDEYPGDVFAELADSLVPVYTHERWLTFVDLAAYNEDPLELGSSGNTMTELAGIALYLIAERLLGVLHEEHGDA